MTKQQEVIFWSRAIAPFFMLAGGVALVMFRNWFARRMPDGRLKNKLLTNLSPGRTALALFAIYVALALFGALMS